MTSRINFRYGDNVFLLPCPSRGMTEDAPAAEAPEAISTPMPLAGHDFVSMFSEAEGLISTPMPLAGHDRTDGGVALRQGSFLLPCPSRGMTACAPPFATGQANFYSHAPRGA